MPNHIQNRLEIIGKKSEVNKILTAIKGEPFEDGIERRIDFNKILPMPKSLEIESGSLGEMAHQLLFGTNKQKFFPRDDAEQKRRFSEMPFDRQKEAVLLAIDYEFNLKSFGATTWYDWAIKNWGTKWNAYHQGDERDAENIIYFQTAWSAPIELMQRLSSLFPKVDLIFNYADEDTGCNVGKLTIKNGEIVKQFIPENQSNEAYEICFELYPDSKEYYRFVNGKYEYTEED
jgi:hypothetical protein